MTPTDPENIFVALVGEHMLHRTLLENRAGILALGLLRPARMAELSGAPPETLALRRDRLVVRAEGQTMRLNHQLPLLAGRAAEGAFLDGHTLQSWAMKLDERVFFWPSRGGAAFANSLGSVGETYDLVFNSRAFFRHFTNLIDLSPINSGSATRRPTRRGDWLYVPATEAHRFRHNRSQMNQKTSADIVREISLRADVPADRLWSLLA